MRAIRLALLFTLCGALFAQSEGEDFVTVPKKYVSAEGISHQTSNADISRWAGVGREIGIATKEGLGNAVEAADKFGATRVGNFILFMVAWKIIGREIIRYVVGLPLWATGIWIWIWVLRRFFLGYQVLDRIEGKTKIYKRQEPYKFGSGDGRVGAGIAVIITIAAWNSAMLMFILG